MTLRVIAIGCWLVVATAHGADLHVDPEMGDDQANGIDHPVRTLARVVRLAGPGDTIHLQPGVYRDWVALYGKAGDPDRPITIDGHGATLEGCDPMTAEGWVDLGEGLYRHDNLLPLTDAIIARWFFLRPDGTLNRMRRCSKGPSEPFKEPGQLGAGEWTFVKDEERTKTARAGYIHGAFYIKLAPSETPGNCGMGIPYRPAGVLMTAGCRHWVIKNITARHPYNDGFNLSDAVDIRFENIRAEDCGDDGISAHAACRYTVDGFVSRGNATGICDTGSSETRYRHVRIEKCVGFDLYFLDTGKYEVRDAVVRSAAVRPLYLLGRAAPEPPCRLTLENVRIERDAGAPPAEVRVSPNCRLEMRRCTVLGLDWQVTGGECRVETSSISGEIPATPPHRPTLHLWPGAKWTGVGNVYGFGTVRMDRNFIPALDLAAFRTAGAQDTDSQWLAVPAEKLDGVGASLH